MFRYTILRVLLAMQVMCFGLSVIGDTPAPRLLGLEIQSEHKDDAILVQAAAGLLINEPLTEVDINTALSAVELTDRFRKVEILSVPKYNGVIAKIKVSSWPIVERIYWRVDVRSSAINRQIRGLRAGMRLGNIRLATWSQELQMKLVEIGYPDASVSWIRDKGDKRLTVNVRVGTGALLRKIDVIGDYSPYTADDVRRFAKLLPGRTLWTKSAQHEVSRNIYKVMRSHRRYEAEIECQWNSNGTLVVSLNTGPIISIEAKGSGVDLFHKMRHLIPLTSADFYSPELLHEGDRRIVRYLQNQGYLDAKVWHRRENSSSVSIPHRVKIVYVIYRGKRHYIDNISFTGNAMFEERELKRLVKIPMGTVPFKRHIVSPYLLDSLESKIKLFYLSHGYSDITLRRQFEYRNGKNELIFKIKEGPQQILKWLKLELPFGWFKNPYVLGQYLALIISDDPKCTSGLDTIKRYGSNRSHLKRVHGLLDCHDIAGKTTIVTLTFSKPIPLVRGDLARVINAIRQLCLPSIGVVRPLIHLSLEPINGAIGAYVKIPLQPIECIRRLVVTGADKTKAKAVFREIKLCPHLPLDNNLLNDMQYRLNSSNAFQRVDVRGLLGQERVLPTNKIDSKIPWGDGDVQLILGEGPPYAINSSFSYDKDQGYRIGLGLTQLNVGGMGRTIEYGIRVGDRSIKSPALSSIFPSGAYSKPIDSVTVSYTDPWFIPEISKHLPVDRTQYRVEVAYIREYAAELLYRRRVLNALQWSVGSNSIFQLGHRWERIDHTSQLLGHSKSQLSISAPYIQLTRDTRDSSVDPFYGKYSMIRVEFANQPLFSSEHDSFIKLDLKNQRIWPIRGNASKNGLLVFGLHLGIAKPTNGHNRDIPYAERFFAGGSFSFRGTEPNALGPKIGDELSACTTHADSDHATCRCDAPSGGQCLILMNLDYRFPCFGRSIWGEVFVDSGQVYRRVSHHTNEPKPSFSTALGFGLIFKVGVPIKIEYATDLNRVLSRRKNCEKSSGNQLLISAGYQF